MHETSVQEERGDQRGGDLEAIVAERRGVDQPGRDVAEDIDQLLRALAQKQKSGESQYVDDYQRPIDDRRRASREGVADGNHFRCPLPVARCPRWVGVTENGERRT